MYYADIITKDDLIQEFKEERLVIRKMFNNIKSCKHAITQSLLAKPRDVHEVVIYKHFETKPSRIHGYYEWTGERNSITSTLSSIMFCMGECDGLF